MNAWLARVAALGALACATACGSSDGSGDGSGGPGGGDDNVSCGIAIQLSGASNMSLDLGDTRACIDSTSIGLIAFEPPAAGDIDAIELRISALMPGQTATALPAGLTLDHEDGSEFTPTGCTVDITENSYAGMLETESTYRVVGSGSCAMPGVSDTRSISVVGLFRFVATPGWTN